VWSQDQLADASSSSTQATNANHAQQDNWLIQLTLNVLTDPTLVTLVSKSLDLKRAAMHVLLADLTNFQILQELDVSQDHLLNVVASQEEI
jgi:hypothetical protein